MATHKFLLYIDILGFSDLVVGKGRVRELYEVLDSLNAHRHVGFATIVFSDTILVYNDIDIVNEDDRDRSAIITRLCEFAQDLFYRFVGNRIYFRGYITSGEFFRSKMKHLEAFYGDSLVRAHTKATQIACTGLFIDAELGRFCETWFKTDRYDEQCEFIHLMPLYIFDYPENEFPINPALVFNGSQEFLFAYDIVSLKYIYYMMNDPMLPSRIRVKYQSTWCMIRKRYAGLLNVLERASFDPQSICNGDWSDAIGRVGTDRGFYG